MQLSLLKSSVSADAEFTAMLALYGCTSERSGMLVQAMASANTAHIMQLRQPVSAPPLPMTGTQPAERKLPGPSSQPTRRMSTALLRGRSSRCQSASCRHCQAWALGSAATAAMAARAAIFSEVGLASVYTCLLAPQVASYFRLNQRNWHAWSLFPLPSCSTRYRQYAA